MYPLLRVPKVQLILILFLTYLTALKEYPTKQSLYLLLISLGSVIFFDLLFTFLRKRKLFIPYSAIVTGLIIALIINESAQWYHVIGATSVAMATKNFLRPSGRHIFNPAAIGLLVAGIVFAQHITWWGVSFQSFRSLDIHRIISFLVLVSLILISAYRMRRLYSIVSFHASYTLLSLIFTFTLSWSSLATRIFDPTIIFFSTVMLPEPMTSPIRPKRQIAYGLLAALLAQAIAYPPFLNFAVTRGLLPDLLIPALLVSNLLFFKLR